MESGRHEWPSRDPIAEKGGVNLYDFVNDDPENNADIFGLFDVDEVSDGFDIMVGSQKYHVGKGGGTIPFNYSQVLNALNVATGASNVKGKITLTLLDLPRAACKVSKGPVVNNGHFEKHLWPLPATISYISEKRNGESKSVSSKTEAQLSAPNVTITSNVSGTGKYRKWGVLCGLCLEAQVELTASANVNINWVAGLAFAPVFATAGAAEKSAQLGLDAVFAN
jgi:hypothetical protein